MNPDLTRTSTSLLEGLKDPANDAAWRAIVDRYRPLVVRFALRLGLTTDDAEDVAQGTLLEFARAYRDGDYDRDRGRLRSWLFGISRNQLRELRRGMPREVAAAADSTSDALAQVADRTDLDAVWEKEWRAAVLRQCLAQIRHEVEPETYEAFRLYVLEENPAEDVARELKTTANAIWSSKRRITKRLRELMPLMEETW